MNLAQRLRTARTRSSFTAEHEAELAAMEQKDDALPMEAAAEAPQLAEVRIQHVRGDLPVVAVSNKKRRMLISFSAEVRSERHAQHTARASSGASTLVASCTISMHRL